MEMVVVKKLADLSFAGCGFLGLFHVGSLAAFRKYQAEGDVLQVDTRNTNSCSFSFYKPLSWGQLWSTYSLCCCRRFGNCLG